MRELTSAKQELHREEMVINMGPQHPSTHGVLRAVVTLEGETVRGVDPVIGYLHRCFEKICEQKTWTQVIPYTDRTDYVAALTNELAYVLAVEKLMGLEVPERAQYIRVIMAELQRIASHLLWFGTFGNDLGAFTPFLYAFRERETLIDIFEKTTGARLTYNYIRLGGVRNDLPADFERETLAFLEKLEKGLEEYHNLLIGNAIFEYRTKGLGVLTAEQAVAWGASGPTLRASGVAWDLRKSEPYLVYDRFDFEVPVGQKGDIYDRCICRMKEMEESAKIVRQALEGLPEGDVVGKVPRVIKPPQGQAYAAVEAPRGELGCFVVSDGGIKPYRVKWRSPCFVHLQLLDVIARGELVADFIANIGSIDIILGEVDR